MKAYSNLFGLQSSNSDEEAEGSIAILSPYFRGDGIANFFAPNESYENYKVFDGLSRILFCLGRCILVC